MSSPVQSAESNRILDQPMQNIRDIGEKNTLYKCLILSAVRHGQCKANSGVICAPEEDILTTNGIEQAKRCGVAWKHLRIDYLYSSTLIRAQQTAGILSDENEGHPIVIHDPDVVECYQGKVVERAARNGDGGEVRRVVSGYGWGCRDYRGEEGGENMIDVNVRARKWIVNLMTKHGKVVSERPACFEERRAATGEDGQHDGESTATTTSSIEDIPEDLPHIVLVSHSNFLSELYEAMLSWNEPVKEIHYRYENGQSSRHVLILNENLEIEESSLKAPTRQKDCIIC